MSKIGIVTNGVRNGEFGGSHIYLSQLCHRLIQNGWDVRLFTYSSAFNVLPEQERFVSLGKTFGTPKQLVSINRCMLGLKQQLSELDVIHTDWWLAAPALRWLTRKHNIRYIHDSRNSLFDVNRIQNVYKSFILKFFHPDHIVFVDHVSHALHQSKFVSGQSSLISVPIDTEIFTTAQNSLDVLSDATPASPQPFRLLFASWLRKEKGLLDLLSALETVWQTHAHVELIIAGEGYLRPNIESLAAEDERVTYLGRVSNKEMPRIYADVDMLVYPSYFEGFPRAILEAYACGVPTVATEVGGLALLQEKEMGLIVPPGHVAKLAEAICQMIENPAMREQFAKGGQRYVLQEHSWPVVFERITQLYSASAGTNLL